MMASNRFADLARAAKTDNLMVTARARHITAAQVADRTEQGAWVRSMLITNTPGVERASDETWRCLIAALEACERLDAAEGVPERRECGCLASGCCVRCCLFPHCSDCGRVA